MIPLDANGLLRYQRLQAEAVEAVAARFEETLGRADERLAAYAREALRDDLVFHLEFLRAALEFGLLQPMVDYLRWLGSVLVARHVPVDHLAQTLDWIAEFFERALRGADAIVLAGTIRDRYLSSRWKLFFDRSFFNNHTPSLQGRQVALLVSGPLGQLPHLRDAIQAWAEFQRANFAGAASDESGDAAGTDSDLTALALRVADGVARGYVAPRTFLGVGLAKVFRDDVFGRLRFPFLADDRNYRALGLYDFPQRQVGVRVRNAAMSLLMRSARLRDRVYRRELLPGMLRPFERLFERDD